MTGVSSTQGYSVNFGDGTSGSAWQADTETANTYYVSHTYTSGGTFTAALQSGTVCSTVSNTPGGSCTGQTVKTATVMVMASNSPSNGSYNSTGAQSFDVAGMMASAVMAPYNLLVESLTDLFVAMGVGQ
jgi:hypothetical protein